MGESESMSLPVSHLGSLLSDFLNLILPEDDDSVLFKSLTYSVLNVICNDRF